MGGEGDGDSVEHHGEQRAECAFSGLAGADCRGELGFAKTPSGEKRGGIRNPGNRHATQQQFPVGSAQADEGDGRGHEHNQADEQRHALRQGRTAAQNQRDAEQPQQQVCRQQCDDKRSVFVAVGYPGTQRFKSGKQRQHHTDGDKGGARAARGQARKLSPFPGTHARQRSAQQRPGRCGQIQQGAQKDDKQQQGGEDAGFEHGAGAGYARSAVERGRETARLRQTGFVARLAAPVRWCDQSGVRARRKRPARLPARLRRNRARACR